MAVIIIVSVSVKDLLNESAGIECQNTLLLSKHCTVVWRVSYSNALNLRRNIKDN